MVGLIVSPRNGRDQASIGRKLRSKRQRLLAGVILLWRQRPSLSGNSSRTEQVP